MRAGTVALQHTLTLQAAVVLKNAVADARRRGHPQVQPLHVAAMLLACPGSPLRQACIQSHSYASSHPLHCRALELCFNIALERLPASGLARTDMQSPGLSHALIAALKRAQAQQRRGCSEQQQQPLLTVRVEMEHLVISILDDPSVSRVMREAGFNSMHVKCNVEEAAVCSIPQASASSQNADQDIFQPGGAASPLFGDSSSHVPAAKARSKFPARQASGLGEPTEKIMLSLGRPSSDSLQNCSRPRKVPLVSEEQGTNLSPGEDLRHVLQILIRPKRRNPILTGDSTRSLYSVVQELAQRIEKGAVPNQLQGVQFLSPKFASLVSELSSKEMMDAKLAELQKLLERCMPGGAILYLGDLQWLLQHTSKGVMAFCPVRHAALELGRLLVVFGTRRVWVLGTASFRTYTRCQTYYPWLETQWGLQPLPIPAELRVTSESRNWCQTGRIQTFLDGGMYENVQMQVGTPPLSTPADEEIESWNGLSFARMNCEREFILLQDRDTSKSQLESTQSSSSPVQVDDHNRSSKTVRTASFWLNNRGHERQYDQSAAKVEIAKSDKVLKKCQQTCHNIFHNKLGPQWSLLGDVHPELSSSSSPLSVNVEDMCKNNAQVMQDSPRLSLSYPASKEGSSEVLNSLRWSADVISPQSGGACLNLIPWVSTGSLGGEAPTQPVPWGRRQLGKSFVSLECSSQLRAPISYPLQQDDKGYISVGNGSYHPPMVDWCVQTDLALKTPSQEDLPKVATDRCEVLDDGKFEVSISSGRVLTHCKQLQDFGRSSSSAEQSSKLCGPFLSFPLAVQKNDFKNLVNGPLSSVIRRPISTVSPLHEGEAVPEISRDFDAETFKGLCKRLTSRVPWQVRSVKVIVNAVLQCRSCMGRRRGSHVKSDTWLLLLGPDRIGKRKIARGLAEFIFGDEKKFLYMGSHRMKWCRTDKGLDDFQMRHRGRTSLDVLVNAVRQNPFSVLLLEDVDQADVLMKTSLVRAMERGRLADSTGREASFANVIVVMTACLGDESVFAHQVDSAHLLEDNHESAKDMGLKLLVGEEVCDKSLVNNYSVEGITLISPEGGSEASAYKPTRLFSATKRKFDNSFDRELPTCKRSNIDVAGQPTAFDLNLSAEENDAEGSIEDSCSDALESCSHDKLEQQVLGYARKALSNSFCSAVDEIVVFHPIDWQTLLSSVLKQLTCFSSRVADLGASLEVEVDVLKQMAVASWETIKGEEAMKSWVLHVLDKGLEKLICIHGNLSGKAVKLVRGESSPYVEKIPLPCIITVGHDQDL